MVPSAAIVGAGVSGLSCGAFFAEHGYRTTIFAEKAGPNTTSGAAAAIWFPYDVEPLRRVLEWALQTYRVLIGLANDPRTGVSMIELRQFSPSGALPIPEWAIPLGARPITRSFPVNDPEGTPNRLPANHSPLKDGFALAVPLMDTTIYLDYLRDRFLRAGGEMKVGVRYNKLEEVSSGFDLLINCAGIGARMLVGDNSLEPHRGQVAIVSKIPNLNVAIVCDGPPLMYSIPRTKDCVLGGTNEPSDCLEIDPEATSRILAECTRALGAAVPPVVAERVGLRPFRKSGVRLERDRLGDGRSVIHNYGHGGSGFTLSWGCASAVLELAARAR
jgi:D-amino-acid oxidase